MTCSDSEKKVSQGWGADEGEAELKAETAGEGDAAADALSPSADASGWGVPAASGAALALLRSPLEPAALEWSGGDAGDGLLLARFDGGAARVEGVLEQVRRVPACARVTWCSPSTACRWPTRPTSSAC